MFPHQRPHGPVLQNTVLAFPISFVDISLWQQGVVGGCGAGVQGVVLGETDRHSGLQWSNDAFSFYKQEHAGTRRGWNELPSMMSMMRV